MRLEAIHIANGAQIADGLLSIEGSGWESYNVGVFPTSFAGVVAGVFVLDADDFEQQPYFAVRISDTDGHLEGFEASGVIDTNRPPAPPGVDSRIPFALPFSVVARQPTVAQVSFILDGKDVANLTVAILSSVPDTPG